jgi:hypothetical protein
MSIVDTLCSGNGMTAASPRNGTVGVVNFGCCLFAALFGRIEIGRLDCFEVTLMLSYPAPDYGAGRGPWPNNCTAKIGWQGHCFHYVLGDEKLLAIQP